MGQQLARRVIFLFLIIYFIKMEITSKLPPLVVLPLAGPLRWKKANVQDAVGRGGGFVLVYKFAALVELSLVILENSGYVHLSGLPLGGGQIQQIGLVFATAYVIAELAELLNVPPRVQRFSQRARRDSTPRTAVMARDSRKPRT